MFIIIKRGRLFNLGNFFFNASARKKKKTTQTLKNERMKIMKLMHPQENPRNSDRENGVYQNPHVTLCQKSIPKDISTIFQVKIMSESIACCQIPLHGLTELCVHKYHDQRRQ